MIKITHLWHASEEHAYGPARNSVSRMVKWRSVTVMCVPPGNACPQTYFPSDICSPEHISLVYLATIASVIYVSPVSP